MRKTWNPSTRDVAAQSTLDNKPRNVSPSLLELDMDSHFSLSPSSFKNDRRHQSQLISSSNNHYVDYCNDMLLSTPESEHNSRNAQAHRRPSRPKVPTIVTTFGFEDSPLSQRQQQLHQLQQQDSRRCIESPLCAVSSPFNHIAITNTRQVSSPTSITHVRSSNTPGVCTSSSDVLRHSTSAPIDIYGGKDIIGSMSNLMSSSNYNNFGDRARFFSNNSLSEFTSPSSLSSPFGLMTIGESLLPQANGSNSQLFFSSKIHRSLQQSPLSGTPQSAPAVTTSSAWARQHYGRDSPISPLMASPLQATAPLGSSPLVSATNAMSSGHNLKTGDFDLGRVVAGLDNRTTFMIKNLPNKYTQVNILPKKLKTQHALHTLKKLQPLIISLI